MPKSKRNRKKKSKASSTFDEDAESRKQKLDALIEAAETAVDRFNYDEAELKLKEILQIDPNHTKCLEMLSGIYIDKFEWQRALDLLLRCIEISPDDGYTKYFSIAQLCEGLESVKYYEKGIQLIEKEYENNENIEPSKEKNKSVLLRNVSDAYCSIAEIFMTDCCFEENAEEKCTAAIDLAIKSDSSNPEAYQCLASYQLYVKGQEEDAKESVRKSLSLWLPHRERLREGEVDADIDETLRDDIHLLSIIPNYDIRIKTSKLLIELEMYYEASKVLDILLEEDDEVVEVWYLLGWLNYIRGEDEYKKTAHFYLKKAKEVSIKMGVEDHECIEHTNELLEELKSNYPISESEDEDEDENENAGEDSDFSIDSESDDKMEI